MRGLAGARLEVNAVLEWLWDVAVNPVLNELGLTQVLSNDDSWARIWWIGCGLLSLLPLHAAGYHEESIPLDTTIDRVISSYAPTIKSLSYARERAARSDRKTPQEKAVLISMPTTPNKQALPYVKKEVTDVESLLSKAFVETRVMENPRKSAIISELPRYTIVHFSCHGNTSNDPSQSHFLLEDLPLTVSDIISLNIESAKFAYLSACHTSGMRNFRLLDESINLSSAIQLCGYPSVVGSLWTVPDEHSAKVARDVYGWILRENGGLDA
jgi:CHAT domain-containing protein